MNELKERKNLLVFGYGLAVILAVFALRAWFRHGLGLFPVVGGALAVMFLVLTVTGVERIKPFYQRWMKVAHLIGVVVSTATLIVLFVFIFTPVGLILRVLRKDLLDRSWGSRCESFWSEHQQNPDPAKYRQQF